MAARECFESSCSRRSWPAVRALLRLGRAGIAIAALVTLLLGCGSTSPVDMWITKDPDAGAGFVPPMREAGTDAAGGEGGAAGSATGGAGGDNSVTAGSGGNANAGASGTAGVGGGAGA